ncbi:unnamed protein product [Cyclocybe aegerita]|uniref:Uncharacterized protein n=1 Tax=Cyclocybe aegerita TaxID=1973307 RepID=A0A8S0WBJ6_CYCAE|nr:unnamed protein product [Cyclocybe aegerita]
MASLDTPELQSNFSDFTLPGLKARADRLQRLIITMAHSYSLTNNPRNLECYLYGPWDMVLNDLIYDIGPQIFVIPQQSIYPFHRNAILQRIQEKKEAKDRQAALENKRRENMRSGRQASNTRGNATSSRQARMAPQLQPQQQPTIQGSSAPQSPDASQHNVGDTSLETLPDQKSDELAPDFVLLSVLEFFLRGTHPKEPLTIEDLPKNLAEWDTVRIGRSRVDLVAEVKPAITRHPKDRDRFNRQLLAHMASAQKQAVQQVERAFKAQADESVLETVLALACIGEWWSWVVVKRENAALLLEIATANEESSSRAEREAAAAEKEAAAAESRRKFSNFKIPQSEPDLTYRPSQSVKGASRVPRSPRAGASQPIGHYKEPSDEEVNVDPDNLVPFRAPSPSRTAALRQPRALKERKTRARLVPKATLVSITQPIHDDVADAVPHLLWSRYLRLGTGASNQAFYLIHHFIQYRSFPARQPQTAATTNRRPRSKSSESPTTEDNPPKRQKVGGSTDLDPDDQEDPDGVQGPGIDEDIPLDPRDSDTWSTDRRNRKRRLGGGDDDSDDSEDDDDNNGNFFGSDDQPQAADTSGLSEQDFGGYDDDDANDGDDEAED